MRPVRVHDSVYTIGRLECPRCCRPDYSCDAYGIVRITCAGTRCRKTWTAIRLPPGSTGQQITDVYGFDVARAIWRVLRPSDDPCSDDAVSLCPLPVPQDVPTYLIRVELGRGHLSPVFGWARASSIILIMLGGGK